MAASRCEARGAGHALPPERTPTLGRGARLAFEHAPGALLNAEVVEGEPVWRLKPALHTPVRQAIAELSDAELLARFDERLPAEIGTFLDASTRLVIVRLHLWWEVMYGAQILMPFCMRHDILVQDSFVYTSTILAEKCCARARFP